MNYVSRSLILGSVLLPCLADFQNLSMTSRISGYTIIFALLLLRTTQWEWFDFERGIYNFLAAKYKSLFVVTVTILVAFLAVILLTSKHDDDTLFSFITVLSSSLFFVGLLLISIPYSSKGRLFYVVVFYTIMNLSSSPYVVSNIIVFIVVLLIAYFFSENGYIYKFIKPRHGWKLISLYSLLFLAVCACMPFSNIAVVIFFLFVLAAYIYPMIFLFHNEKQQKEIGEK